MNEKRSQPVMAIVEGSDGVVSHRTEIADMMVTKDCSIVFAPQFRAYASHKHALIT
jgi:hypothetical protein